MSSQLECPRCRTLIDRSELPRSLGPFRSSGRPSEVPSIPRCTTCEVTLFEDGIASVADRGVARLTGSPYARNSVEARESCAKCFARLMRVTIDLRDDRWVEVEECAHCGLLVVDDTELKRLVTLLASGVSLPWFHVELVEQKRYDVSSLADLARLLTD